MWRPVVGRVGLFPATRIGERIVELLLREAHCAVPVGRVREDREQRLDLGRRVDPHALGWRRVDHHGGGAQPSIDQELGEGSAEWLMMIGGVARPSTTSLRWSTVSGTD